jgi:hypothetical protein
LGGNVTFVDVTGVKLQTQRIIGIATDPTGRRLTLFGLGFLRFGRAVQPTVFRVDVLDGGTRTTQDQFGLLTDPNGLAVINQPLTTLYSGQVRVLRAP